MKNVIEQLIEQGFTPRVDFDAQDDSDGRGPYIVAWHRDEPCPVAIGKPEPEADA